MGRKDEIRAAYRKLGSSHSVYDNMMLGKTPFGRAILKHVWNMSPDDALEYQTRVFEPVPADFPGDLLEVPVGTGVLTMPVYAGLKDAHITCLDYSEKMMESAKKRAEEAGIRNVFFQQGDVGKLPFADGSFDIVVSMNGFHAFPDKEAAYAETYRVLKKGGLFTGCFYVQNSNRHTDRMIRSIYVPLGFFTRPFETKDSLERRLKKLYTEAEVTSVQSIAVFRCIK